MLRCVTRASRSRAQRAPHSLDAREDAVLVVPIAVVELGEIMRVLHILEREAWLEPSRERQHLLTLQIFERAEAVGFEVEELLGIARDDIAKDVPSWPHRDGTSRCRAHPEAMRARDPHRLHFSASPHFVLEAVVHGLTTAAATHPERIAVCPFVDADEEMHPRNVWNGPHAPTHSHIAPDGSTGIRGVFWGVETPQREAAKQPRRLAWCDQVPACRVVQRLLYPY
jgi:hypothetical protein